MKSIGLLKIAKFIIFLACFLNVELILAQSESDSQWGYSHFDGPEYWCNPLHEGQCCRSRRQSPINIETSNMKFMSEEMNLFNYNVTAKRIVLANNGRTAVVHMFGSKKVPHIRLGTKHIRFGLDSFHFHWGSHDNMGSEHAIDGTRYSLELHLVHINEKYETLEEAREHPDGIAVLGILFNVTDQDNSNLDKLARALDKIKVEGDYVDVRQNFAIDSLLPSQFQTVYAYRGSLTTPPCSEAVTWFVIAEPNSLNEQQMIAFRNLRTTIKPHPKNNASSIEKIQLVDNFRPLQELQHRQIFRMKGNLKS